MGDDHPNLSPEALEALGTAQDSRYWIAAAVHPNTEASTLREIVEASGRAHRGNDHDARVHGRLAVQAVAARRDLSSEVVVALGHHPDHEVRTAAAANPEAPSDALRSLAASAPHDQAISIGLAENPSSPPDVLTGLLECEDPYTDLMLASNPSSPPDILGTLAQHDDTIYGLHVAQNPGTPPHVLELLALSDDEDVRAAVMEHPQATERIQGFLGLQ